MGNMKKAILLGIAGGVLLTFTGINYSVAYTYAPGDSGFYNSQTPTGYIFNWYVSSITESSSLYGYTGTYMFTVESANAPQEQTDSKNNKIGLADLEWLMEDWFSYSGYTSKDVDLSLYDKTEDSTDTLGNNSLLSVTYGEDPDATDSSDLLQGTWSTANPIEYYIVKGSDEFALYWLGDTGLTSGDWTTEHLNTPGSNPTVSHINAYNETSPIPEPATMLLFGTGLAGLAGISRRKKK